MKFVATYDDYGRPLLPDLRTKRYVIHTHNIVSFLCLAFIIAMCAYIFMIGLAWTL